MTKKKAIEKWFRKVMKFGVESNHTCKHERMFLMNLRCIYCQTPFSISRSEMLGAIITMNERNQSHYDAHCPRCRRANSISRQRVELFYPNWKEDAAKLKTSAAAEPPVSKAEPPASAFLKTEPLPKAKVAAEKKPAEKKPAAKPAATKSAAKPAVKKTTTKTAAEKKPAAKPAVKKTTTTTKKK